MSDGLREYDREYETPISHCARKRLGYNRTEDEITRFVVQLEYELESGWTTVVRYDHDVKSEFGHDVSEEGVHIDIYRDGEKYRTEYVAPPMPARHALDRAEDHLANNLVNFIRRFEEWHEIRPDR
ncbi:DUF7718 family protein [Natrarchaeobius oligotrophus]|uniref:DUF7718 domain-containing protein n=1 Tax=Natrarchaeobius chitinivorans TaxID=1679083 RepID=A0A3N6MIV3_NATCH|nr:hypothetical protein [Natrarchaeobius chitinivorans]RQH03198.1 hypothetical protein EA472_01005 [Natrarchaeobius chitinivorans]